MSQISQENISAGVSFLIKLQGEACNFIKKETLAQLFSCEFCEILRTPFVQNTSGWQVLWTATSETLNTKHLELKSKEGQKFKRRICLVNVL